MLKRRAVSIALLMASPLFLSLAGCTTTAQSNPARTATEELLISTAAEHAAQRLSLQLPPASKIFVDNTNFEGTDSKYAIGAIRTDLAKQGLHLVDDKKSADIVVETRAGALSTDRTTFLIGIPQFNVPVPFASAPLGFPEIALYSTEDQKGVAKFAITGYDAKQGSLVSAQDPQYGFSHNIKKTVMIFISWDESDALPDEPDDADDTSAATAPAQPPLKNETPHPEVPLSAAPKS